MHPITLEEPQITYCEGGLLLRCLFHLYLSESRFEIQAGKVASTHQALQHFLYSRKRVGILFVQAFRWPKSIQKWKPPSFFQTNTMVLHQALWLGLIVPDSNISFKWFLTSSTNDGGIYLNHSLKGVSSVTFIICSVEWVQPNSAGSNKNTSWYSAMSWQAASSSARVHESRLLKSNLSNKFPCLCLTVSLGVWESWDSSAPSCNCSPLGGSGTGNATTTQITGVFLQRVCKYVVLFHTTTTAFLLPFLYLEHVFCTVRPWGKEPSWVHRACTMTLIHSPVYAFLSSLVLYRKRRDLWFLHSEYTSTGHHHLYQIFPSDNHPIPWASSYALIGDVPP